MLYFNRNLGATLTLCSLPRTNPGDHLQYKRVNGPYTLIMTATGNYKLPYGTLPRLLMAWVSTEAVRTGITPRTRGPFQPKYEEQHLFLGWRADRF